MNDDHIAALNNSIEDICQSLDTVGVLPYLRSKRILNNGQVDEIKAIVRKDERNMKLVDFIIEGGPLAFNEFINALNKNGKQFLADIILKHLPQSRGSVRQDIHHGAGGGSRRSPSAQALTKNLATFHQNLAPMEIITRLESAGIFTRIEAEQIREEGTTYKKNVALINLVRSRGPQALEIFAKALEETLQTHLASFLYDV